jgi:hypothetical protein
MAWEIQEFWLFKKGDFAPLARNDLLEAAYVTGNRMKSKVL